VTGETYNIGGENELENLELIYLLCEKIAAIKGQSRYSLKKLIAFVKDRPGHDRRYAIDCSKIKKELGWARKYEFAESIEKTIVWYIENPGWVQRVRSGEYRSWIQRNYEMR
jgi:dTDP-glucose 4,6-dehydratase